MSTGGPDIPSGEAWSWAFAGWDKRPAGSGRSPTTADVCRAFLRVAHDRLGCRLASAWSLDPVDRRLILIDVCGLHLTDLAGATLDCATALTGTTVERKRITRFTDLTRPDALGRSFSQADLVARVGLTQMVSVPVFNTSNHNQVLLVINLFPGPGSPLTEWTDADLDRAADDLAVRVEAALRERCERFANRMGTELGRLPNRTPEQLCLTLARLVRRAIDCDRADVFLEVVDGTAIAAKAAIDSTREYEPAPGDTAIAAIAEKSWRANRELLNPNPTRAGGRCAVVVPLRNPEGRAKGIVCCTRSQDRPFIYDDVAVLEAIGGAFLPHLVILLAEQRRVTSLSRLVHELRVPLVAFRAALERLRRECDQNRYAFQYDHLGDLDIYCNVMSRQFNELDMTRTTNPRIPINPRPTSLPGDIIAPAKRYVIPLLNRYRFSPNQLTFIDLEAFKLWLDRELMTQVVFNLLENAIKYYQGPPEQFRIEIRGEHTRDGYDIAFRDWGVGVPEAFTERIFDCGFRAPDSYRYSVTGDGIGLWLAREIVRRHGGTLTLRSNSMPTEFVIHLPVQLARTPPEVTE